MDYYVKAGPERPEDAGISVSSRVVLGRPHISFSTSWTKAGGGSRSGARIKVGCFITQLYEDINILYNNIELSYTRLSLRDLAHAIRKTVAQIYLCQEKLL